MLLTAIRGDTSTWTFKVLEDGFARDLTSDLIRFTVKADADDLDSEALIRLSSGTSGVTIAIPQSGSTKGEFDVTLLHADTVGFAKNLRAYWDVQIILSEDGTPVTPFYGDIMFVGDITHNTGDVGTDT